MLILVPLTLALLLVLTAAAILALVGSDSGTRLLAGQAKRLAGEQLDWDQLDCTLLGPLRLQGLRIKQPGLDISLDTLALDWQPAGLIGGQLVVTQLEVDTVRVNVSDTPETPPPAAPFRPGDLPLPMDVRLEQLNVRNLQVLMTDQVPLQVSLIDLAATLVDRQLVLQKLEIRTPEGGLQASGRTELADSMPLALQLSWDWLLPETTADNGSGQGRLPALRGEMEMDGSLSWSQAVAFDFLYQVQGQPMTLLEPQLPEQVALSGQVRGEWLGEVLALEQLTLALREYPLQLDLRGKLGLPATGDPTFDLSAQWRDLQWPLDTSAPELTSSGGEVGIAGSSNDYRVTLAAALAGNQIPAGQWSVEGRGDLDGLVLDTLQGQVLDGVLQLDGSLGWNPAVRWSLAARGSELNPGLWMPDYPGQLNFILRSSGQLQPDQGPAATIELQRAGGEVAGYAFDLSASAALNGEIIELESLLLASEGNSIAATGLISEHALDLDWQLNAPAPGALLDGARGQLKARGQLLGSAEAPRLTASLLGQDLGADSYTMDQLQGEIEAGLVHTEALQLDFELGAVQEGEQVLLESGRVRVSGSLAQHGVTLALQGPTEQLQVALEGGLEETLSTWTGVLSRLDVGSNDYGNWALQQPATLSLAATAVELGETCLEANPGAGRLCAHGNWSDTGAGSLEAAIQALPVASLLPQLDGAFSGELKAELAPDGSIEARAALAMSPGSMRLELEQGAQALAHGGADLTLTVGPGGLDSELRFAAPAQGQVHARVQLPAMSRLPLPDKQPLSGYLRANLPDLSALPALVPELTASAGSLNADLTLAGSLDQPRILGQFALLDGAADIPLAGLQLRQITLRANSDQARPEVLSISGGMRSGPGEMTLEGKLELPGSSLALNLTGDRLQVYNTEDARILASPDLQIGWSDDILTLRGQLLIPEADITPKLGLTPAQLSADPAEQDDPGSIIQPSPDVVVLNADGSEREPLTLTSPIRLDNQVALVLGERVNVNALGFISQVTGTVNFRNDPAKMQLIPEARGRISLENGTFRAFGQDLDIETGQIIYAGVPVTDPELNVRAVRWIDNDPKVSAAGVMISGPTDQPSLELFSRPQVEASEIQSYLLTGRSASNKDNVLGIGTYIHPKFYVGYGYNLLEKTSEFNSLYTITPRYGLGGNFGEADNNLNLTFTLEH